jgi:hypothetical protein
LGKATEQANGAASAKPNSPARAAGSSTRIDSHPNPPATSQPVAGGWLRYLLLTTPFASAKNAIAGGLGIAAAMYSMALMSYVRVYLDGKLASDHSHLLIRDYAAIMAVVGISCLVAGYCYLKAWSTQQHVSLERLLLVAVVIHCCAFPTMPMTGDDIFVNLANGRLLQCGFNPYLNTPADLGVDDFNSLVPEVWFRWITPYGPINTWLSRMAVSAGGLWASLWAFKGAMLFSAIGMIVLAYGFCRTCLPAERRARAFILLAWNPLLAWELTAQSHNDGPMLVLATAFVWAAFARREWLSSGLLIAAFFAKFAVAPVLGLHLCYRARRSWWRAALTVAGMLAAGVCLYYPFWYGPKTLTTSMVEARSEHWHIINSFVAFACEWAEKYSLSLKMDVFNVWSLACRVFFLGLAAWYAWRATTLQRVIRDSILFLLLFEAIGKGWFFPWYVTWLLPLAMAESDQRLQRIVALYSMLVLLLYIPSNIGVPIAHGTAVLMAWQFLRAQKSSACEPDASSTETQPLLAIAQAA